MVPCLSDLRSQRFKTFVTSLSLKVVVCAEILPRDLLQTLGKYYMSLTVTKIQRLKNFTFKKFGQFLKNLTVKLI